MSDENRINEVLVKNSSLTQIDFFVKACNSVCKILILDTTECGTGFLLKTIRGNQPFYCLISCEHVIKRAYIKEKKLIRVFYDNQNKSIDISLDETNRFIREYTYMDIDVTVVEIQKNDNIEKIYFLSYNSDYLKDFSGLDNENIIILQYPLGGPLNKSKGKILSVDKYQKEFSYNASTNEGSSGSPIFMENTSLVIGIHKQGSKKKNSEGKNYGNFIGPVICSLMDNSNFISYNDEKGLLSFEGEIKIIDKEIELFGKHIIDKNKYFIGKKIGQMMMKDELMGVYGENFLNIDYDYIGLANNFQSFGEGIIYINNKVYYKGEFAFGRIEGTGTLYFDNGNYYIGQFNNNKMHGKGVIYSKDNKPIYSGEFVNSKKCGNGILIGDEFTYDGQFKDDKFNGKGTLKTKSNHIFEGNFVNGNIEGQGQLTYPSGNFYIGNFQDYKRNGDGILFSSDGTKIYEGTFVNDKYDGDGKLYLNEDCYYDGHFKNGEKNGHGEIYDKYNNIILEGQFNNDKLEGSYKYFKGDEYYIGEYK